MEKMEERRRSEVAERGNRVYEDRIRALVEVEHFGKVVSIEVNSGDYEIAADRQDRWRAVDLLWRRHPNPQVFSLRVGGGEVARIGGHRKIDGTAT